MKNFALFPLPLGSWLHHSWQYKYNIDYGLYECELPNELTTTLSQKQFGKYCSAEIFPASMGILPVLF
jgi:hypothetical protein